MSLINDALKRASQSEKNRPRDPGLPPAMQPAPESGRSLFPAAGVVAVVALLAAAGWLAWRALPHHQNPAPPPSAPSAPGPAKAEAATKASRRDAAAAISTAPLPSIPSTVPSAEVPAKLVTLEKEGPPAPVPAPLPAVVTPTPYTNPPATPPAPDLGSAPVAPPFPDLKLQGIFYSRTNARAAINWEIHRENELSGEVRIVAITPNRVTVEWKGQTRNLNLGAQ